MELTGKNFVAGKLSSSGVVQFRASDPLVGEIDPPFYNASAQEIDEAIENAKAAFNVYRNFGGRKKADFLEAIAAEMLVDEDKLSARVQQETRLGEARIKNELQRTLRQITLFANLLRDGSWVNARVDLANAEKNRPDIRSMQRPIGPIGVFGASNFPLAFSVAGGDTISALAAGCSVVFKAHPAHPGTSEIVGTAILRAIQKTSMPVGLFSMVHGNSNDVGMHIVQHPLIKAIAFTGSFMGGKALYDAAASRPEPIPVYAEMGSTNPVFILPGALRDNGMNIGTHLAASVTLGTGQFCTNPGVVFHVNDGSEKTFVNQLVEEIERKDPGLMLTSGIASAYSKGIDRLLQVPGMSLVAKGNGETNTRTGLPHVLQSSVSHFLKHPELQEEVFGPSTILFGSEGKSQLMAAAEKLSGHLTATIIGNDNDLEEFSDLISILEQKAGRLIINGYPTGVEVCDSMVHGGPFPATTDSRSTSVGTMAIYRFTRAVAYQNFPDHLLPDELKNDNPGGLWRMINGSFKNDRRIETTD
jgi:NADP-dependent aldehyde dehydrogenase